MDIYSHHARLMLTLELIEKVILRFPVPPQPPLKSREVQENINVIFTLVSFAKATEMTAEDEMRWDLTLDAILAIENSISDQRKPATVTVADSALSGYINVDDRYGNPVIVTPKDYTDLNPGGTFDVRGDGIYEQDKNEKWIQVARPITPGSD